jgi:hypothetical protein
MDYVKNNEIYYNLSEIIDILNQLKEKDFNAI